MSDTLDRICLDPDFIKSCVFWNIDVHPIGQLQRDIETWENQNASPINYYLEHYYPLPRQYLHIVDYLLYESIMKSPYLLFSTPFKKLGLIPDFKRELGNRHILDYTVEYYGSKIIKQHLTKINPFLWYQIRSLGFHKDDIFLKK